MRPGNCRSRPQFVRGRACRWHGFCGARFRGRSPLLLLEIGFESREPVAHSAAYLDEGNATTPDAEALKGAGTYAQEFGGGAGVENNGRFSSLRVHAQDFDSPRFVALADKSL
jgi:hypothetical protein